VLVILCALATVAHAQPKPPPPPEDPIGDKLFPPDLIMGHQQELGLDDVTRKTIVAQIQQFQAAAVKIQWDLKAAGDALANLLAAPAVDEAKALAEADKVMVLEHDLKRAHLTLLIRLKNALTPTQQTRLRGLRGH
jgi:Spy/CpxP family protein refolding chaperone